MLGIHGDHPHLEMWMCSPLGMQQVFTKLQILCIYKGKEYKSDNSYQNKGKTIASQRKLPLATCQHINLNQAQTNVNYQYA